jgi:DNA (cytosine-5)-methyltransferase 1
MIAVDLFCGAGGLTRGLLNTGIEVVLGIDLNEDCRRTYEGNNKPAKFLCKDLRDVTAAEIRRYFPPQCKQPLLLVGCAPCQPFSSYRRILADSEESRLLREFGRIAHDLKPDWILIENVPGLAKVPGFSTFRRFQRMLAGMRYNIAPGVIDAKAFGVPQTRRRFVMIGSKRVKPSILTPTHGPGKLPYVTVREAIAHYPRIWAGHEHADVANHRAAAISELNLTRLRHTRKDGGRRLDWSEELQLDCHRDYDGHSDVYGRMKWDAPAPTLTCRCYSISNGRYGHPTQQRAISFREAAALQTFPDDYVFFGKSHRSLGAQIGNAVPVLLAEVMGRHILGLAEAAQICRVCRRARST